MNQRNKKFFFLHIYTDIYIVYTLYAEFSINKFFRSTNDQFTRELETKLVSAIFNGFYVGSLRYCA